MRTAVDLSIYANLVAATDSWSSLAYLETLVAEHGDDPGLAAATADLRGRLLDHESHLAYLERLVWEATLSPDLARLLPSDRLRAAEGEANEFAKQVFGDDCLSHVTGPAFQAYAERFALARLDGRSPSEARGAAIMKLVAAVSSGWNHAVPLDAPSERVAEFALIVDGLYRRHVNRTVDALIRAVHEPVRVALWRMRDPLTAAAKFAETTVGEGVLRFASFRPAPDPSGGVLFAVPEAIASLNDPFFGRPEQPFAGTPVVAYGMQSTARLDKATNWVDVAATADALHDARGGDLERDAAFSLALDVHSNPV